MNILEKEQIRQLWISRITDLSGSGLSQKQWCIKKNIPVTTLRYWISKLRDKEDTEEFSPRFVKLEIAAFEPEEPQRSKEADKKSLGVISIFYGDFKLEIDGLTSNDQIHSILSIIKRL